jgi:hypothetical protein
MSEEWIIPAMPYERYELPADDSLDGLVITMVLRYPDGTERTHTAKVEPV